MAYLDEDILYNNVEEKYKSAKGKAREAYSDVLDTICEMPRADVVPKSEVAKIFEEIEKVIGEKYDYYVFDNRDIEGDVQDAIIAFADAMTLHFAELKKKYTKGE